MDDTLFLALTLKYTYNKTEQKFISPILCVQKYYNQLIQHTQTFVQLNISKFLSKDVSSDPEAAGQNLSPKGHRNKKEKQVLLHSY